MRLIETGTVLYYWKKIRSVGGIECRFLDVVLKNTQSELWKTIKDLGEPLVENCSSSRLIYHFEASYFETIESQLNMRQDWITNS